MVPMIVIDGGDFLTVNVKNSGDAIGIAIQFKISINRRDAHMSTGNLEEEKYDGVAIKQ